MYRLLGFLLCFLLLPISAYAQVSAQSCIVIEATSQRVLYEKNADTQLPMASTTKIMTALVALEAGDPDTQVTISKTAAGVEGSSMYLEVGEILTVKELLYGLMLASGNDAAVAIAEQFGGMDTFVKNMNQKAESLGVHHTQFKNPNGLPHEGHYSTARDMATITAAALKNPHFAEIVATKTYGIKGEGKAHPRQLSNHNKLLRMYPGCIGVKTGFTKAAGRCLVSAAQKGGMTLICVTLNAPDDWNDHISLYNRLFSEYSMDTPLSAYSSMGEISVKGSDRTTLPFGADTSFFYPLKQGETLTLSPALDEGLSAPVSKGDLCGTVQIKLGDKVLCTQTLVALEDAPWTLLPQTVRQDFMLNLQAICKRWLTLSSH
ncbi:MAG: D-alanyl-D-alanine carboxypeptidase [Clostridia bacterium]|nr:D-alanyl-D-alanine carboxypeptidase [Clostridia bacterium]